MSTRTRKNHRTYEKQIQKEPAGCTFCTFKPSNPQVISEHTHFWIVKNKFPYDLWDQCGVLDHLMIVPKRHTDTLSALNQKEQLEYMKLLSNYESIGYSLYARAPSNTQKSITHQHSHLLKLDNNPKNLIIANKQLGVIVAK